MKSKQKIKHSPNTGEKKPQQEILEKEDISYWCGYHNGKLDAREEMIREVEKKIDGNTVRVIVRGNDPMSINMGDVWNEAMLSLKRQLKKLRTKLK